MFDAPVEPLKPCPFSFYVQWEEQDGTSRRHTCDDWETSTAFYRRRKILGETEGIKSLKQTYEEDFFSRGIALAFSTHSRRKGQWLLVGIIRINDDTQRDMFLSTEE